MTRDTANKLDDLTDNYRQYQPITSELAKLVKELMEALEHYRPSTRALTRAEETISKL